MKKKMILVLMSFVVAGCAALQDAPKKMAGVSRRSLEAARQNSIYQEYRCDMAVCFDAVMTVAGEAGYNIFMKDPARGFISLMNIEGVVDTTEVGVFLTGLPSGEAVRIEVASRSTPAKKAASSRLFSGLSKMLK